MFTGHKSMLELSKKKKVWLSHPASIAQDAVHDFTMASVFMYLGCVD